MISMRPAASTRGGLSPAAASIVAGSAGVAELAYAMVSKAVVLRDMWVRIPPPASSMCGRYTLTNPDPMRLRARFDILESVEGDDPPRYNIAPTDPVFAVRRREDGSRDLGRLRWGLVPGRWAEKKGGRPLINARAESLERAAGLPRRVSRTSLPDSRRRLLRVADRRARQAPGVAQPSRRRAVRVRRALGRAAEPRGRRRPAQLHDRHLRPECARAPDPQPDAGDPRPGGRRSLARPRALRIRAGGVARPGARRTSWSPARSATWSTACARMARR